jgi:hypothetical protein
MHTTPVPEIDESELKAVREFLTSFRDEERAARMPRAPLGLQGTVPVRNGITRARARGGPKTTA